MEVVNKTSQQMAFKIGVLQQLSEVSVTLGAFARFGSLCVQNVQKYCSFKWILKSRFKMFGRFAWGQCLNTLILFVCEKAEKIDLNALYKSYSSTI